jgi:hypothetical protein
MDLEVIRKFDLSNSGGTSMTEALKLGDFPSFPTVISAIGERMATVPPITKALSSDI